jgi:hypothetical protein
LALSNIDKYKNNPKIIDKNADQNYNDFKRIETDFKSFGENDKIYTNLESMKNKLSRLIENGYIKEDSNDVVYKFLSSQIEQIISIQTKPSKKEQDIFDIYHTYNNFNDMFKRVGGDHCV